jgi:hypothetical protein
MSGGARSACVCADAVGDVGSVPGVHDAGAGGDVRVGVGAHTRHVAARVSRRLGHPRLRRRPRSGPHKPRQPRHDPGLHQVPCRLLQGPALPQASEARKSRAQQRFAITLCMKNQSFTFMLTTSTLSLAFQRRDRHTHMTQALFVCMQAVRYVCNDLGRLDCREPVDDSGLLSHCCALSGYVHKGAYVCLHPCSSVCVDTTYLRSHLCMYACIYIFTYLYIYVYT